MENKEIDYLKLEICSRMGHSLTDNYSDGLVQTAILYKNLTGHDLGIKSLKKTADAVNGRTSFWKMLLNRLLGNYAHPPAWRGMRIKA